MENRMLNHRYKLESEIGRGGMGVVYRATDTKLNRTVAIKILPPEFVHNVEFLARFKNEILNTSILRHPNIVSVFDVGVDGDTNFYVMQYVEGQDLRAYMNQHGRLSITETSQILEKIASALDYAHSNGIIHRDIKPENILIDNNGVSSLTDFGIASLMEGTRITMGIVGSPEYMSPEQGRGEPVCGRSDQYSLAIIAYEMLTGTTPFRSSTAQPWVVITKHINEPPADPRTIIPTLAKNSAEAIIKGLAKNIGQRYPSCARFVDAIKSNVVTTSHINQLPSQPNITAPTLVFNKVETIISSITCVFEKQPNSVYPLLTEKIEHTDEPINIGVTVKKHFPKKPIMIIGITSVLCVIILLIGFSKRENLSTDNNYNNLSNTNTTPKYNISRINTENNSKTNVDNPVPTVITTNPNNRGNRSTRQNYNQPTSYNYNTSVRKEPKQVYSETVKSILTVAGSSDYDMSLGSGFFVNNGIIATNEHVVRGNNVFVSRIIGEKDFLQFTNLRHANRNIDIAFLTVPNGSGNPLQLGDDNAISVGDTVYTIGNPEGYEGTFSTGIISAIRKNDEGTIDEIQFTAPTSSGSSGGPVLDINGKVIGIVYRGSTKGQNINLAIPVSKLKNYMSECGISYY